MIELTDGEQRFLARFEPWSAKRLLQPVGRYAARSTLPRPPGYTIVDVETTSTNREQDRIVQISVRRCDADGRSEETFSTLLNPDGHLIDPQAQEVHGISADMLVGQPKFVQIADRVLELLSDRIFTAFNASFDLAFVRTELARAGHHYEPARIACLLEAYRVTEPDLDVHKLSDWAQVHSVAFEAHDADEDTRVCELILQDLIARDIAPESVEFNEDLWVRRKVERDSDNSKAASPASIRYLFVLARKVGWVDDMGSVLSGRVRRLCAAINDGVDLDSMSQLQQSRMVDAFTLIAIERARRAKQG
jgi:DNA polymerase III epsilon subunit-like protein